MSSKLRACRALGSEGAKSVFQTRVTQVGVSQGHLAMSKVLKVILDLEQAKAEKSESETRLNQEGRGPSWRKKVCYSQRVRKDA